MRAFLIGLVLVAGLPVAPSPAQSYRCTGDYNACLSSCLADSQIDRRDCERIFGRPKPPLVESVPVLPNSRSKYRPVPQGGGGAQQPGPYVNQQ